MSGNESVQLPKGRTKVEPKIVANVVHFTVYRLDSERIGEIPKRSDRICLQFAGRSFTMMGLVCVR